ncbi:MAG TPA: RNA polymerase sigma factor [Acidimicrobiales bacterium]|jgi:RNA polymerase sigma-70 factor (ECF subfamily)|nr:RNA polymerase sigma factor [Acidimicrobiales bacterium]
MTFGPAFDGVLSAARCGAPWAMERLYRELAPAVAGYLRVQGSPDADDLTSDVFVKVFGGITGFAGSEERFRSWVFTIAHHRLVDERRQRARRPVADDAEVSELADARGGDAEAEALRRLSLQRVQRLCDRLAPDQRDVLLLRMVADMTLEQTADALGKSVGAVKALQHRGVSALRRLLEREGVSL